MNFTEKYTPSNLNEVIGNPEQIKKILDLLEKNPYRTILVHGPKGCGKSMAVRLILTQLSIRIRSYDTVSTTNDLLISELVNINHNNIVSIFKHGKKKELTAFLVDNIDRISLSQEKNQVDDLINYNVKNKKFPLILICNTLTAKELEEYHSDIIKVSFHNLTLDLMSKLVKDITLKENREIGDSSIGKIVSFSQKDLRRLLHIVGDIFQACSEKYISDEFVDQFIRATDEKTLELDLFDSMRKIMCSSDDIQKVLSIYNNEKVLLPLILHENYIKDVFSKKLSGSVRTELIANISNLISEGDLIETDIYTDQNWLLQDTHCFMSLYKPVHILSNTQASEDVRYSITFSSELNKTSLKNINRKNISNINSIFKINTADLLDMSFILNQLVQNQKYEEIKFLLKDYNIDDVVRVIEVLLKIDKCNDNITLLNAKMKKNFLN